MADGRNARPVFQLEQTHGDEDRISILKQRMINAYDNSD